MAIPEAFRSRKLEDAELDQYRNLNRQLLQYAADSRARERGAKLLRRYSKHPWLSPGVAVAYEKWQEQVGTQAARGLARTAFEASGPGATRASVNQSLDDFIATKDFQRQVASYRKKKAGDDDGGGGLLGDIFDSVPVVGPIKGIVEGASPGEIALRAVPGAKAATTIVGRGGAAASKIPGIGPSIKGISRVAFTAMESPYQEVQAGAVDAITGLIGPIGDQAKPLDPNSEASRLGAATRTPDWEPTSTGAMALRGYDLGEGFFPGGAAAKAHERAVRNIASLTYGGKSHFATPGRMFAATVTEPGTDPFNVLSGSIDALGIIKTDPANLALTGAANINKARKSFSAAEELAGAGGLTGYVRSFVHGPTAQQWLDNPKAGGRLLKHYATEYAGRPERLSELLAHTNYKYPTDVYRGIMEAAPGDSNAIRSVLEPALGTSIERLPQINTFSASIRNATHRSALLSELPRGGVNFSDLDVSAAPLRDLHNYLLGIGLDEHTISRHVNEILTSHGRVERSEAVFHYFNAERDALVARGVPQHIADNFVGRAFGDVSDARTYFDRQIGEGTHLPGYIGGGEMFPMDKPFLVTEHLGDRINLPPLLGKDGRGQLLARYGNILGIPKTGSVKNAAIETVLDPAGNPIQLEPEGPGFLNELFHRTQGGAYRLNTAGMHVQSSLWKPLALIRGAWTVRVIGEEQVRMAMAGIPALFNHPLSYIAMGVAKKGKHPQELLDFAAEQKALRGSMEGAFNIPGSETAWKRVKGKLSETYEAAAPGFQAAWADTLTRYSEDPVMRGLAVEMSNPNPTESAIDAMRFRLWEGDLAPARADLATSKNLLDDGIDMSTQAGVDRYVDELYDRLHFYTQGDSELIGIIANQQYTPSVSSLGKGMSLAEREVLYDGRPATIVKHRKGSTQAEILLHDENNVYPIHLDQLTFGDDLPDQAKLLTQNADGVTLDDNFVAHLGSKTLTPPRVTSNIAAFTPEQTKLYDKVVRGAFTLLMDIPATKLNRSHVFLESYLDEIERLLPHVDEAGRTTLLAQAREDLFQAHKTGIFHPIQTLQHPLEAALKGRYTALERAAARGTGTLTAAEAELIAKGHSLDSLRELLYDTAKRNKALASSQLIAPFGEAWKEMIGSWGRILVERPQTLRKVQIGITAARGANPLALLPGAVPDHYADKGFIYKDPNNGGADTFFYPWSLPFNEQLTGVSVGQTGDPMSLSMGFNLLPGIGPGFQMVAGAALDRYLDDPKWDPLRNLLLPYGSPDLSEGVGNALEEAFAPAWLKKVALGWTADPKGTNQDARALNSLIGDVLDSGAASGEYDLFSKEGIARAYKDAETKARELYFLRGTFQSGAPAAPRWEFFGNDKNGKLVPLVLMRDALYDLYKEDPDTAVTKFLDRFGENAMFATGAKTLGTSFGQQFTQQAYDWERTHPEVVDKYPLAFPEFAPRSDKDEPLSWAAWLHAVATGQREAVPAKERVARVQQVLGSWQYDRARKRLGLKRGEAGTKADQEWLREKRNEIHELYPSWRRVASDTTRIPAVIDELVEASSDPTVYRSNPRLHDSLADYVEYRRQAIAEVEEMGGGGDFNRVGFSSSKKYAYIREWLREKANRIGVSDPQFLVLWQDTFAREMSED